MAKMKKFFKGLFLIGMGALLCTGCGGAEPAVGSAPFRQPECRAACAVPVRVRG